MSNSQISELASVRANRAWRWLLAAAAVTVILPSIGHAQLTTPAPTTTAQFWSGHHWLPGGALATVTVNETGTPTAFASVRIELRDPTGRVVAATNGTLGPATPVQLRFQSRADAGLRQLSMYVKVTSLVAAGNTPMTVWENIGPTGFIWVAGMCGPPGTRGGAQEMCRGAVDDETTPE